MPTLTFRGTIIPTTLPLPIGDFGAVTWQNLETGAKESFSVSIHAGKVKVLVELDVYSEDDLERHRIRALDLASTALNTLCFQNGWAFSVSLENYTNPAGEIVGMIPGHPSLARYVSYPDSDIAQVYETLVKEPYLYHAMNDLIMAIGVPHLAAINCARAVESVRTLIAPGKRGSGWSLMQSTLNLTEAYVRPITKLSEAPRHGDRAWISHEPIEDVIERSWIIMDRFIEWRRKGENPLPLDRFPIL